MQFKNTILALFVASALIFAGCLDAGPEAEEAGSATMAPDSQTSMPLVVTDAPWNPETVTVNVQQASGLDVTVPNTLHVTDNDTLAGWIMVEAPADAGNGDHEVVISVENDAGDTREFIYHLNVQPPETPIAEGDIVVAHVTARTEDGQLAFTTDENIAESPLPQIEGYQAAQQHEPLDLQVMHGGDLSKEIVDELLASGVGHSFTVEVPDFFGPAVTEMQRSRENLIERVQTQRASYELPREQAVMEQLIHEDAQVGDPVNAPGLPFPFVIEEFREAPEEQGGEIVVIKADVEEGETVELHAVTVVSDQEQGMMMQPQQLPYPSDPAWEGAASVQAVNDTIEIRIDPPYSVGESFTWVDGWDDATEIVHMDDNVIQLRHSPEEGMTYTEPPQQPGMEATEATIATVGEENIIIEHHNPNPLGGALIFLDFTIHEVHDAPQQPPMQPGQPGGPQ